MFFVPHRITLGTPVPKAPVEFVDSVRVLAVAIHEETNGGYAILAGIAGVLNVMALIGMRMVRVDAGHQIVVSFQTFRGESLQDFAGSVGAVGDRTRLTIRALPVIG